MEVLYQALAAESEKRAVLARAVSRENDRKERAGMAEVDEQVARAAAQRLNHEEKFYLRKSRNLGAWTAENIKENSMMTMMMLVNGVG